MAFFVSIPVFFDHIIGLLRAETLFRQPASYTVPTRSCGSQKLNIYIVACSQEWLKDVKQIQLVLILILVAMLDSKSPPGQRFCLCHSKELKTQANAIKEDNRGETGTSECGERAEVWLTTSTQRSGGSDLCLHTCRWRHVCQGRVLRGLPGSLDLS